MEPFFCQECQFQFQMHILKDSIQIRKGTFSCLFFFSCRPRQIVIMEIWLPTLQTPAPHVFVKGFSFFKPQAPFSLLRSTSCFKRACQCGSVHTGPFRCRSARLQHPSLGHSKWDTQEGPCLAAWRASTTASLHSWWHKVMSVMRDKGLSGGIGLASTQHSYGRPKLDHFSLKKPQLPVWF